MDIGIKPVDASVSEQANQHGPTTQGDEIEPRKLRDQLERIVTSSHFRNSRRYPAFLRFVVEHTLDGNIERLKERTLGIEVFGRQNDYDTNADPIVRVTAGEVRKRIAQYYQDPDREHEVRINLPLGSYIPQFLPNNHREKENAVIPEPEMVIPDPPPVEKLVSSNKKWRWWYSLVLSCILISLILVGAFWKRSYSSRGMDYFWSAFVKSPDPVLIVMGVHAIDATGKYLPAETDTTNLRHEQPSILSAMSRLDMLPISDLIGYSKVTDLLTKQSRTYQTQSSAMTNLEELQHGPVVLIGGLDNIWTLRLTSVLRYKFVTASDSVYEIQDSQNPAKVWALDYKQPAVAGTRDYAIVARYFDSTIERPVIVIAGIGKNGTAAATEFLTTDKYRESFISSEKLQKGRNVEIVLSTDALDGKPGPPHVITSYFW